VKADFNFTYPDPKHGNPATQWVRIFSHPDKHVVVMTDRSHKYTCASITNSVEDCVQALLEQLPLLKEKAAVWIEHYDERPEEWDLVTFTGAEGRWTPNWKRINRKVAEELAGEAL
jgi:hypothetical protein